MTLPTVVLPDFTVVSMTYNAADSRWVAVLYVPCEETQWIGNRSFAVSLEFSGLRSFAPFLTAQPRVTILRVVLAIVILVASQLVAPGARPAAGPVLGWAKAQAMEPALAINEFVAANNNGITDNTGAFEDWIELHNPTTTTVALAGWTIQDSSSVYTFTEGSVPPDGYRVLFASGDTGRSTPTETHLPLKLTAEGEPLTLRSPTGVVSSPDFPAPGYPSLPIDVSYGQTANGGLGFFTAPTPGESNRAPANGLVSSVSFSVPHGFYSTTQSVLVDTATPSATIRYTLDGSTPTPTSGTVVSPGQTISVSSTSIVRALAYRTGWIPSNVETRTYLFTSDIVNQSESRPAPWPADRAVNDQAFDYGMDPNLVSRDPGAIANSLTAIPSLSIVTDQDNLTDGTSGIYVNAFMKGRAWEHPASIELIDPTGAEPGFETNGGLRIRGGGSRRSDNPKHSLRVYFRDEYGDGALEYPLFGDDGVDRFESLGLATGQNGSWSFRGEGDATWVRDPWIRETQAAMGQPNTDSRYYHLYLNGLYWGLYYSQERLSGSHGAEHFGGSEQDYDVVGGNWVAAATASDGSVNGLRELYPLVADLRVNDSEFVTLAAAVDLENLADYFLLHFFTGDWDAAPMGWDTGQGRWADSNNWRAFRNRNGVGRAGKWIFFDHDSEFTLCGLASSLNTDNTTPWNLTSGTVPSHQVPTPAWLHEALIDHPTYRQIFQDRVAEHLLRRGGALTDAANQSRFDAVIARVTGSIDAEAARWGDSLGDPARDRIDWNTNIATMRQCATDRQAVVQNQLQADGLWPSQNPPSIAPASGAVAYGTTVTIDNDGQPGSIWYTTDGTDPRSSDGALNGSALIYASPIPITESLTLRARVLDGGSWTPLATASYMLATPAGPVTLLLNEYNAVGASKYLGGGALGDTTNGSDASLGRVAGNGGDWFELVALDQLDLRGWTFEIWHRSGGILERSAALVVRNDAAQLAQVQPGTIITVSEDIADDLSWEPIIGDWHINLQANAADAGAFFTTASQQNFAIDNDETQIAIFDSTGQPVALPTGEGSVAGVSVNSEEVFKLEGAPSAAITFDHALYADGTSSTWGLPNVWSGGTAEQDFTALRFVLGDVNCDGNVTITDALITAQYSVRSRTARTACPINAAREIFTPGADVNSTGDITIADALLIAQCSVRISHSFCPN